jgi:hypothetical protein
MRNLKTYFSHKKRFNYFSKIRYAQGVGDVCAAILHSKLIGPITYLVTEKLEPCNTCQNRRTALNFLFPVPIWKLFFKNEDAYNEALNKEFEKAQKELESETHTNSVEIEVENKNLSVVENTSDIIKESISTIENKEETSNDNNIDDIYKNYFLIAENRTEHESVLIVNRIYKKL